MEGIHVVRVSYQPKEVEIEPVIHVAPAGLDPVERLQQILTIEQGRTISNAEAARIGESLIDFFEVLAS